MARKSKKSEQDLQQLVADADTGGRAAGGIAGKLIFAIAIAWSLFQLWYASPLPFAFGWGATVVGIAAVSGPPILSPVSNMS